MVIVVYGFIIRYELEKFGTEKSQRFYTEKIDNYNFTVKENFSLMAWTYYNVEDAIKAYNELRKKANETLLPYEFDKFDNEHFILLHDYFCDNDRIYLEVEKLPAIIVDKETYDETKLITTYNASCYMLRWIAHKRIRVTYLFSYGFNKNNFYGTQRKEVEEKVKDVHNGKPIQTTYYDTKFRNLEYKKHN